MQCILCDQVFTNSSLKLSELKIHFATHGGSPVYGIEALKTKRARYDEKGTLPQLHITTTTMQKPILMASYRAANLIAKSKKAHNIGENLIKPCPAEKADILLGNEAAINQSINLFICFVLQNKKYTNICEKKFSKAQEGNEMTIRFSGQLPPSK